MVLDKALNAGMRSALHNIVKAADIARRGKKRTRELNKFVYGITKMTTIVFTIMLIFIDGHY